MDGKENGDLKLQRRINVKLKQPLSGIFSSSLSFFLLPNQTALGDEDDNGLLAAILPSPTAPRIYSPTLSNPVFSNSPRHSFKRRIHRMQLGLTESLPALVAKRFTAAKDAGHLIFSQTHLEILRPGGVPVSPLNMTQIGSSIEPH